MTSVDVAAPSTCGTPAPPPSPRVKAGAGGAVRFGLKHPSVPLGTDRHPEHGWDPVNDGRGCTGGAGEKRSALPSVLARSRLHSAPALGTILSSQRKAASASDLARTSVLPCLLGLPPAPRRLLSAHLHRPGSAPRARTRNDFGLWVSRAPTQ